MPYTKTTWVDRVVSGGTVITAGTPLSASNLNKIENQLQSITTLSEGALQKTGGTLTGDLNVGLTKINGTTGSLTQTGTPATMNISPYNVLYIGRSTNSGTFAIQIFKGDNTTSTQHFLSGASNSYLNALSGNVGIGNISPSEKLDVTGNIKASGTITTAGNISTTGTGAITSANGLTVSSGGASITGNTSVTGTLTATSTLTAQNGLTVSAGTVSLPNNSIPNTAVASLPTSKLTGTILQSQMDSGSVGRNELKTAVDGTFSGNLSASSTNGTLLGGIANFNPTFSYAFFPQIRANSQIAVVGGGSDTFTDGRVSFGLRNSANSQLPYQVYIRYVTA